MLVTRKQVPGAGPGRAWGLMVIWSIGEEEVRVTGRGSSVLDYGWEGQDWVVASRVLDFLGSQRVQAGPGMAGEALLGSMLGPGSDSVLAYPPCLHRSQVLFLETGSHEGQASENRL